MLDGINLLGSILFFLTPGAIYFPAQPLQRRRQPRTTINYFTFVNSVRESVSRYQILLSVAASNVTKGMLDFVT